MGRYRVTKPGLYGANGMEVPLGTEFDSETLPVELVGKVEEVGKDGTLVVATPAASTDADADDETDYEKMKVDQLKQLAASRGIELEGASRKDDIIAKITAADEAKKAESEDEEDPIDRAQLEQSATTLGVAFTAEMSDEDLLATVKAALGD